MTVSAHRAPVKAFAPTPQDTPSRRRAHAGLPAALFEARGDRLLYRIALMWRDPTARRGRREEVIEFADPRKLADLLRRIASNPDRPLLSFRIRAKARPIWCDVSPDMIAWRADEAERRARSRKGGAR